MQTAFSNAPLCDDEFQEVDLDGWFETRKMLGSIQVIHDSDGLATIGIVHKQLGSLAVELDIGKGLRQAGV